MPATDTRVALIGPVLPFRGGIAQHTTMLLRTFSSMCAARAFSFTRQYPAFLFPGASDRDPAFEGHVEPGTDYLIDSANPLTWGRAVDAVIEWRPDVVVLPWWQAYWAPLYRFAIRRLKAAGVPVVFLCHNVTEHETAAWKRSLTRSVLSRGDGHVVQSNAEADRLRELVPGSKPVMHLHPAYDQFPDATGSLKPEHDLELLFFGFIRPYKGLDVLIEALALLPADLDVRLTVAGESWQGSDENRALISRHRLESRVELVDRYLTESEVAEYFARAHALVLPYRSATGSGVAAIAFHYGKPLIVTRVGGLPDVVEDGVTGFVVEPGSPSALADAILELSRRDPTDMVDAVRAFKQTNLTWPGLAEAVLEAGGVR